MRTLGVDLSANPKKTAACLISWQDGKVEVEEPVGNLTDGPLVDLMEEADRVGIDAPFGWPAEFVEAITSWAGKEPGQRVPVSDCATATPTALFRRQPGSRSQSPRTGSPSPLCGVPRY